MSTQPETADAAQTTARHTAGTATMPVDTIEQARATGRPMVGQSQVPAADAANAADEGVTDAAGTDPGER